MNLLFNQDHPFAEYVKQMIPCYLRLNDLPTSSIDFMPSKAPITVFITCAQEMRNLFSREGHRYVFSETRVPYFTKFPLALFQCCRFKYFMWLVLQPFAFVANKEMEKQNKTAEKSGLLPQILSYPATILSPDISQIELRFRSTPFALPNHICFHEYH